MIKTFREAEAVLPVKVNRWKINQINHARRESVRRELAMPLVSGGSWNWPLAEPNMLLAMIVSEPSAARVVRGRAVATRCSEQGTPVDTGYRV